MQPTTFPDGLLDLTCNEINTVINGTLFNWNLKLKAKGDSDLYVTQHTFPVGAHTGWHTHPGPSLITVISGALTVYEASDPTCTPKIYTAGQSFTDIGCGDVHLVRNEGSVIAQDVAVQIVPKGAPRRIDVAPAPSNCPLIACPKRKGERFTTSRHASLSVATFCFAKEHENGWRLFECQ